ncbi:M23 family metallopeptidase [Marinicella gelatinilytica]|uniref:M23 family metallopeptidase n=1 Tax=Marinicella gelatinilytica TaxID=2996017 RepID=UPI002260B920|nr:M23 family metallopeptidase [Marinicella gelatinilytica]MCX7544200.1 M23 family metallopeptidase [Marinicella gelatinilytica]
MKLVALILLLTTLSVSADDYFLNIKGQAVQGGLLIAQTNPDAAVRIDDEVVKADAEGYFMFGFGRFDEQPKNLAITHRGQTHQLSIDVEKRDFPEERIDGLPADKVNPPASFWERIKKEQAEVKRARSVWSEQRYYLQDFIWPATGRVSGVYGSRRILNGEPKRPHYGMDIANATGSEVVAPIAGTVTMAVDDHYYTGGTVILDHGYGLNSTYLHLSQVNVEVGQVVQQGDKIGEIGMTGRATGPHLDWRINLGTDVRLDPQLLLPPQEAE